MSEEVRPTRVRLAEALRAEIAANPGLTELPHRREIAGQYGLAQATVAQVLRALAAEGLIEAQADGRWTVAGRL
ncbi:GntR family transcriptional regulator [Kitasatospora terrestris]|uniref:HTH gntR-type domain-containing protein n=1 Tax=Kitasatospora terrestris TaxID=258051 RepID=A0ABP9ERI3_9ACTN